MNCQEEYQAKLVTAEEAAGFVASGDRIFMAPGCNVPEALLYALAGRRADLEGVSLISANFTSPYPVLGREFRGHIDYYSFFLGGYERAALRDGNTLPISISMSDLARGMRDQWRPNVLLAQVSPPDKNGYMNFGPMGVMVNRTVQQVSSKIILQVNEQVPWVHGEENLIHISDVTCLHEASAPLPEVPESPGTEADHQIAEYVIREIDDGAVIQIGIGGTGNAVAYGLAKKRHLGIYSEMFTEAMVHLVECGAVDGTRKNVLPGKIVCGFGMGTRRVYDFLDRNPDVHMLPLERINQIAHIAQNDGLVSINNALAVDLTGQVASEGVQFRQHSGTGGQLDFVRGSYLSKGGKSFLTMASTYLKGGETHSKIVVAFPPGTPITTPRSDVEFVVTEFGMVNLKHRSLPARVQLMISIAHPDFRESLEEEARQVGLLP